MTQEQAGLIARAVVNNILDKGMAKSTWKDDHAAAYADLLRYREDMVIHAVKILKRLEIK